MGKRDRRRRRERAQTAKKVPARTLFPDTEGPLVEVLLEPDTPAEVEELCRAYWAFDEPGVWKHKVSDIGSTSVVYKAVSGASKAALLTVLCPKCTEPVTVASRSEMTATGYWKPDAFPASPIDAKRDCARCVQAAAEARAQEAAQAKQQEEARITRRAANASAWVTRHKDMPTAEGSPSIKACLALLSMTEIMKKAGKDSFGPICKNKYTLAGSREEDIKALRELYQQCWISPTLPATVQDFAYNDDDTVDGVYIDRVPWRPAQWAGETVVEARDQVAADVLFTVLESLVEAREILTGLEAGMAVDYLEGLLTRQYSEEPIPDHRRPDAYAIARKALEDDGFTLEQVLAVAWSSAAGSVAWGQRTPGLKPGSVSAAAVTNLERRVGYAKDRPVKEYDLPNWVARPAIRATIQRLLEEGGAAQVLSRFSSLRARLNSRPLDETEFDDDIADSANDSSRSAADYLEELRQGIKSPDQSRLLTFAAVSPDGELDIRTDSLNQMKQLAGDPYFLAERLPLDGTVALDCYVPESIDPAVHQRNPVGTRMVELLGGGFGALSGNVVFFQTVRSRQPCSLNEEHQELVKLAHAAASQTVRN